MFASYYVVKFHILYFPPKKFISFTMIAYFNVLQALSIVADYYYYGRWTSSVLNLLIYNVAGGGESHLYGTEGPLYYLRNGFNNFNFCFVLALLFLGILPIAKRKYAPDLLIVISPIYIWLGFMSLQPHKEERFGNFSYLIFYYKFNHTVIIERNVFINLHNAVYYFIICYEIEMDIDLLLLLLVYTTLSSFYF